jgi:hypothetical protein
LRPTNHRRSKLQEKKAAADYSGRTTPGSGNQWHSKADVKSDTELIECKTTMKDSYSLKAADLRKLFGQAVLENRTPVFEIEFSLGGVTCVVLDKDDFLAMMHGS